MTASHLDGAFERWRSAPLDALTTPGNVMAWQDGPLGNETNEFTFMIIDPAG
jgi:hypothetical protein